MPIEEALTAYKSGDIYWPVTLLAELEEEREGQGFDWIVATTLTFLERAKVENSGSLIEWIKQVKAAKVSCDLQGLREKSLAIWHLRRDQLHTGVSHLYAALVYFLEGDYREYRKTIFYAIGAMVNDPTFAQTGLSIPLEVFGEMQRHPHHPT